jgi:hypothetical protein
MDAGDDATDAVIEELGELAIAQIPFRQQLERCGCGDAWDIRRRVSFLAGASPDANHGPGR